MPNSSEEPSWERGSLSSSLRDTGDPARRHEEAVFGFGLNALTSSPLWSFCSRASYWKSNKVILLQSFIFFPLLSHASTTKAHQGKQSLPSSMDMGSGAFRCGEGWIPLCQTKGTSWPRPGLNLSNKDACTKYTEMGKICYRSTNHPPIQDTPLGNNHQIKLWGDNFCMQLLRRSLASQALLFGLIRF